MWSLRIGKMKMKQKIRIVRKVLCFCLGILAMVVGTIYGYGLHQINIAYAFYLTAYLFFLFSTN